MSTPPKTCETCICWTKIGHSPAHRRIVYDTGVQLIPPGAEGQCRLGPPRDDFRWSLTSAGDWCAQWTAQNDAATSQAKDARAAAIANEPQHPQHAGGELPAPRKTHRPKKKEAP